jgi:hypothetical protein
MFRAQCCAVLGFGLMFAAASTEAREVEFSVESRIGGDNNVLRTSANRVADGFWALSPRVVVREGNSRLDYDFSYRPTYETYFTTSGIDGFDHWGRGILSWRPTAADTVGFSGDFTSRRSLRLEDQSGPLNLVASDRERIQRSEAQLSYNHALGVDLSVQASATFNDVDYSKSTSVDSRAYSGRLGTQYVLDPVTVVGLAGTFRQRESRGVGFQFTTETDIWDVSASFRRALTPTLSLSAQAGPSFIRTTQKAPFGLFPDEKSRSTSYFAAVVIDKTWRRSNLEASYTRSDTSGGGTSSSSITDKVSLSFNHRLSRQLYFRISGSWLQSKEISDRPGGRRQETTQYRAFTTLTRTITSQLSIVGLFSFFIQDQKQGALTAGSDSIGGVYSGFLSLRYTFDPVVF